MTTQKIQSNTSPKRLLLLGCGDIGERLAPLLTPLNYTATGVRRRKMPENSVISYRQIDLGERNAVRRLLREQRLPWDVIVVTLTPVSFDDEGYRLGYVEPIRNIVSAYENSDWQGLIVFVSSTGVYGQNDGSEVDEQSDTQPVRFSGKRLLEAEELLRGSDLDSVSVRFSGIYGPRRERLLNKAAEKKWQPSDQSQWTNRIHVDDCAGVISHLIKKYRGGKGLPSIVLASDSEPVNSWHIKQWLAREQGVISSVEASTYYGSMHNKICKNEQLRDSGYEFKYPTYREGYKAVLDEKKDT